MIGAGTFSILCNFCVFWRGAGYFSVYYDVFFNLVVGSGGGACTVLNLVLRMAILVFVGC